MTGPAAKARRLVGLFLLGAVLFNYPILSLVNRDSLLFGIPILYLYLFGVWAVLILLIARVTGSAKPGIIPDAMEGEEEPPSI
ncbi:MAG: hypothetical protein PVG78_14425 [Desulfobacterales bacterium]